MVTPPLQDKRIILTRNEEKSKELAREIEGMGGKPINMPLIDFRPALLTNSDKQLLAQLNRVDWLIFTSANGVYYFFNVLKQLHINLDSQVKLAVVGTKTKEALNKVGYQSALLPREYVAEGLIEAFQKEAIKDQTIVYVKGNLSRDIIPLELSRLGANVKELTVYETYCPAKREDYLYLLDERIDAITFTSPSTVHHFIQLFESTQWREWLKSAVICCIGPITERAARNAGIEPTIVPTTYTMNHLIHELSSYFQKEGKEI